MRIAITGASGFVGSRLANLLADQGSALTLIGGTRLPELPAVGRHTRLALGAIESSSSLDDALAGADAVIHLAGLVPSRRRSGPKSDAHFFNANAVAVARVCDSMERQGIRRLVVMSSIAARDAKNAYGRSKLAGEREALLFADRTGSSVTVLRPPLVYGPDADGTLGQLVGLLRSGIPIPFASVRNRRSLCSVDNLADATARFAHAENLGSGTFEVCDDEVISLPQMIEALSEGLGIKARLFHVPVPLIATPLALVSRRLSDSLLGDLVLDNTPLKSRLDWKPPMSTTAGLIAAARSFRS